VSKAALSPRRTNKKTSGVRGLEDEVAGILRHRGRVLVVDTDSDYLYIGKLLGVSGSFIVLEEADVHDRRESSSMNEKYVLDSKKHGIRSNRREVRIRFQRVVSYSLLEDVVDY
jgi:hypothetical protein